MSKNKQIAGALEKVDIRRRRFLGNLLAGGAAVAAIPAMSTVVLGQDGPDAGKGKGGKGKGGFQGRRPDPAAMAAELIKEHDKDGDGALNAKELTAALTAMMQRRFGGGQGKGKGGFQGRGKGKGGDARPRRPAIEE